ncbi:hypothetical protein [Streptomyces spectabilis]|uniref:Uncharacterized protein n=1 Tax=Streptomyces spectabilis TaxID=68270 RepID=A0A7W8B1K1_STRST|nr:hypothetical protein [Streptomyces spectabilis]MBB5108332.1 hypothetical protein [Streptomyces spectabilis]MCI3901090.1 hypothetical protein [Streptomyces spectabilis]GGV45914.1 hypothetical protein GCM10010245_71940 [Streptomyces spectabilis]
MDYSEIAAKARVVIGVSNAPLHTGTGDIYTVITGPAGEDNTDDEDQPR